MHTWTTTYYNEVIKTGYLIGTWFRQQMNQDSFLFNCIMQSALESQSTWSKLNILDGLVYRVKLSALYWLLYCFGCAAFAHIYGQTKPLSAGSWRQFLFSFCVTITLVTFARHSLLCCFRYFHSNFLHPFVTTCCFAFVAPFGNVVRYFHKWLPEWNNVLLVIRGCFRSIYAFCSWEQ